MSQVVVPRARTREILREARKKMNDGGVHWIKSRLSRKKKVGMCYCSIGAIFATTKDRDERAAAIRCLVEKGLEEEPTKSWYSRENYLGRTQVESWNDSHFTTWDDVNKTFRKAIRALR